MVPIELILGLKPIMLYVKEVEVRHRSRKFGETNALSFSTFKKNLDFYNLFFNVYFKKNNLCDLI